MAQAEVVTVRMSRGNVETPWGFDIVPPIQISNVIANSLADRAGLLSGDTLVELEGYEKPDYQLAKQLLAKAEHKIELIVHRDIGQGTRIWKPSVTDNTEYSRFQHSVHNVSSTENQNQSRIPPPPPPPPTTDGQPVKVSLEHQPQGEVNIPGFNVKAQPYGARQEVKHLQYNSPMPIYSPQSAAEQYLQQTGGLFGTDPNVAKMTEVPAYLRSETLRLIQEDEARKEMSKEGLFPASLQSAQQGSANISNNDTATAIPQCYLCGRNIQGVMCRAFDHYLHPDCFTCATCGTSLKNQGHHFVNGKFYCSVHGRQFETRNTLPKSSANTGLTVRSSSVTANAKRNQENSVRAFYQPEVMARRPLSISPTPWKTQSPISPNNRGIPHSAVQYGQDIKNESYTSPLLTTTIEQKTTREVRTVSGVDKPSGYSQFNARNEAQTPSDKIASALQNLEIRQSCNNVDSGNGFSRQETRHTMQTGDSVRGRGTLQVQGSRIPYCEQCRGPIRGAYVLANGVAYCPDHFVCANTTCNRKLLEIGFVEEKGQKYCEQCFETLIAPHCAKCNRPIVADCLNALQKQWHPECFVCTHCQRPFGNSAFFLEKGQPYCEDDWNALFTTRCFACNYPIEAGDRWVEALGSAFHSNCFNCTACNVNLEGESFYAKNGAPYCKLHA